MARTKMTARSNSAASPKQGSRALFSTRDEATAPNSVRCDKCERRFAQRKNLLRHQRNLHGEGIFRFQCPLSPKRMYKYRSDLRRHYITQHPEADVEEVDESERVEIQVSEAEEASTPTKDATKDMDAPAAAKKRKTSVQKPATITSERVQLMGWPSSVNQDKASATVSGAAAAATVSAPAPPELPVLEQGRRLVKITETINREYYFE